ncbi:MAG: thioredoxin domain-containing protein, partial [Planctomycetales bacterium]|nr:thioredoxin domain-containing protein [Planctomycetales bacterium]
NALLVVAYTEAYQATSDPHYAHTVRETLDYVLRDMTGVEGGFSSSEDADSEGVEGKFYVWTPEELEAVLGVGPAKTFGYLYDVEPGGNFEGKSILNMPKTVEQAAQVLGCDAASLAKELAESRAKLFEHRQGRVAPGKDDKVLVSWNGLMIDALARAGAALDEPRYVAAAERAANFVWSAMRDDAGRLLHTWRDGRASLNAYLDDYAALANAFVSLYEAAFDEIYIDRAIELADQLLELFGDGDHGGFFYTSNDHERLILRTKEFQDGSIPSGNSLATIAMLRLGRLTGRVQYIDAAERTLKLAAPLMRQHPTAAGQMLLALDLYLDPSKEIVIACGPTSDGACHDAIKSLARQFFPNKALACRGPETSDYHSPALAALFAGREADASEVKVFVCEHFACNAPVVGREAVRALWRQLAQA